MVPNQRRLGSEPHWEPYAGHGINSSEPLRAILDGSPEMRMEVLQLSKQGVRDVITLNITKETYLKNRFAQ